MTLSFETLLILGAIGFYLYDSIELLHINEFALLRNGERWSYIYPSSSWQILRKWPFMPNPFRPDVDIYLVSWSAIASTRRKDAICFHIFESQVTFLRYSARILFAMIFLILPLVLLIYGSGVQLLLLFAHVYGTIVIVAYLLYRNRQSLQITRRRLFLLSFECLACPPFAVNVLRKVTYRSALIEDPISFAMQVLDRDSFCRLISDVCERIEMQLCWLDEDAARYSTLVAYRDHIRGLVQ